MSTHTIKQFRTGDPRASASPEVPDTSVRKHLSKILPVYPQPNGFLPFFLAGEARDPTAITACLWTREDDLDSLAEWASNWPGPISLVLATSSQPASSYESLLKRLQVMSTQPSFALLSVHLFHANSNAQDFPNMYLNIARLFSTTSNVVIFPGNLSVRPPPDVYSLIRDRSTSQTPAILSREYTSSFPFPVLSPAVLPLDHPLWCTERFFFSSSRIADWGECLWQLWLEAFGEVEVIQITGLEHHEDTASTPVYNANIRRRLSSRYRSETCDLIVRRVSALQSFDELGQKQKLQWLKSFCQQASIAA